MYLADTQSRAPRKTDGRHAAEDTFDVMMVDYIRSSCLDMLVACTAEDDTLQTLASII